MVDLILLIEEGRDASSDLIVFHETDWIRLNLNLRFFSLRSILYSIFFDFIRFEELIAMQNKNEILITCFNDMKTKICFCLEMCNLS